MAQRGIVVVGSKGSSRSLPVAVSIGMVPSAAYKHVNINIFFNI